MQLKELDLSELELEKIKYWLKTDVKLKNGNTVVCNAMGLTIESYKNLQDRLRGWPKDKPYSELSVVL